MQNQTFDFEIQNMVTQFIAAIDDIVISRYEKKKARDQVKVRVVYAPKQRVLANLLDKAQNIQLPVVSVYLTGINRNDSRVWDKLGGEYLQSGGKYTAQRGTPVPIDLNIGVTILTRFQSDIDQILTNILAYFNPYIVVSWTTESVKNVELRSKVVWGGGVNLSYPTDLAASQVARVQADLSFTFEGWLFKHTASPGDAKIFKINTSFSTDSIYTGGLYPSETELPGISTGRFDGSDVPTFDVNNTAFDGSTLVNPFSAINRLTTETRSISSFPRPLKVEPYVLQKNTNQLVTVTGFDFFDIQSVYLSGAILGNLSTIQNPFSGSALSSANPSFAGVSVNFVSDNANHLVVVIPSLSSAGKIDVIVQNESGYRTLLRETQTWQTYFNNALNNLPGLTVYPWISGIEIR